jgi:hypothetical protein
MAKSKPQAAENVDVEDAAPSNLAAEMSATVDMSAGNASEPEQQPYAFPIPPEYARMKGIDLLMEACTLFGIDPNPKLKAGHPAAPRHLLSWKHYPGNVIQGEDERIVLTTCGGAKLRYPWREGDDTHERLLTIHGCRTKLRHKDGSEEIVIKPLPHDVTLPTVHVTGIPETDTHVYKRGYLHEGGAAEATRRAARERVPS